MQPALFTPVKIGPVEASNRIVISPMCMYAAEDGTASDFHIQHVMRFAMSGAGLSILEATGVTSDGRISPACLGLWSDENERALAHVLASARRWGIPDAKIGIQLCHAGRKGSTPLPWERGGMLTAEKGAWQTLAPSALASGEGQPMPREMTGQDIKDVIRAFADASRRAARIGFDVIEMHAAHGYLLHQFHSPMSNKRSDEWGGDEERRLRFPLAVAEAMREATPKHVALGARITSTDFVDGGLTVDHAVRFARELKARGFDYVCVSSGNIVAGGRPASGPGFNIERAAKVKAESGMLTRTVGFIAGPQMAEEAVASGAVDQVALARAFLDDPNWAIHAAERLGAPIQPSRHFARVGPGAWPAASVSRAF